MTTMLLRSSSTRLLNSWLPRSKDSSPGPEMVHRIPRTRSITLSASSSSLSMIDDSTGKMRQALSETDIRDLFLPKKDHFNPLFNGLPIEDEEESKRELGFSAHWRTASLGRRLFRFSELDEESEVGVNEDGLVSVLVGGEIGGGGGRIYRGGGGGRSDDKDDERTGFWDSNHVNDSAGSDYHQMIEANPGNPLLLSNYAKYLKEVCADYVKAEEYFGRAILANPNDGNVLFMYADLIWEMHKDAPTAASYFDQAVKTAPDDCYVLASHAHFLWDAEEDPSEKSPSVFHEPTSPALAAAS